jgi:hypothetical protein
MLTTSFLVICDEVPHIGIAIAVLEQAMPPPGSPTRVTSIQAYSKLHNKLLHFVVFPFPREHIVIGPTKLSKSTLFIPVPCPCVQIAICVLEMSNPVPFTVYKLSSELRTGCKKIASVKYNNAPKLTWPAKYVCVLNSRPFLESRDIGGSIASIGC